MDSANTKTLFKLLKNYSTSHNFHSGYSSNSLAKRKEKRMKAVFPKKRDSSFRRFSLVNFREFSMSTGKL